MKKLIAVIPLVLSFWWSEAGADVVRESYQFRGRSADAGFWSYDDCSYASAYVFGGEQVTHVVGGRPTESTYAYAYVWRYDWCTGESVSGWGWTDRAVSINQLNSASLSVPITLSSWTCAQVEDSWECTYAEIGSGELAVTLTGTGEVSRGVSMSQWQGGGYRSGWRYQGSYRAADGVGSLVVAGSDYLAGALGAWGSLSSASSGSHYFYRY